MTYGKLICAEKNLMHLTHLAMRREWHSQMQLRCNWMDNFYVIFGVQAVGLVWHPVTLPRCAVGGVLPFGAVFTELFFIM